MSFTSLREGSKNRPNTEVSKTNTLKEYLKRIQLYVPFHALGKELSYESQMQLSFKVHKKKRVLVSYEPVAEYFDFAGC